VVWQAFRSASEWMYGSERMRLASLTKLRKIAHKYLNDDLFCEIVLYNIANMTLYEDLKCTFCY
jgi:hypothetical protein